MSDSEALRQLYRQLPLEEPSMRLDATVLARVNAELAAAHEQRTRWQRRWRYQVPLATAATLVLAVALLLRQPGSEQALLESSRNTANEAAGGSSAVLMEKDSVAAYARLLPQPQTPTQPPSPPTPPSPLVRPLPPVPEPAPAAVPAPAPPPVPAPVPMTVPPPPVVTMMDLPASVAMATLGIVAERALPPQALDTLVKTVAGMEAPEFCKRLQGLWPAAAAAPDCPTSDGQHAWPAPLAITWQVAAGRVVRAERQP